jgi:phage tail sheath protein FI
MPEYLAPGVYVEEVDTGSKPIEGVSTSTSGMVGVTERGPVNIPTLVTGIADFRRQFGGYLDRRIFTSNTSGNIWYLPHAVEGFFNNGGKRLYVVRVLPDSATFAQTTLFDQGNTPDVAGVVTFTRFDRRLAARVARGDQLLLLDADAGLPPGGGWALLQDGQASEYAQIASAPAGVVAIATPIVASLWPTNTVVEGLDGGGNVLGSTQLIADIAQGEFLLPVVDAATLAGSVTYRIGTGAGQESHAAADNGAVGLNAPLARNHNPNAPVVEPTISVDHTARTLTATPSVTNTTIALDNRVGLVAPAPGTGQQLRITNVTQNTTENVRIQSVAAPRAAGPDPGNVLLEAPLVNAYNAGDVVEVELRAPTIRILDVDAPRGTTQVTLDNRAGILDLPPLGNQVHFLQFTNGAGNMEFVPIDTVEMPRMPGDDPGVITLEWALQRDYVVGDTVTLLRDTSVDTNATFLAWDADPNDRALVLGDSGAYGAGSFIRIETIGAANAEYNQVPAGQTPVLRVTTAPLQASHSAAIQVLGRSPLLNVQAIDPGSWGGNKLRVLVDRERSPLLQETAPDSPAPATSPNLSLRTTVGIEAGSVLEFFTRDPNGDETVAFHQKVTNVTGNVVNFGVRGLERPVTNNMLVRTVEFQMEIELVGLNRRTRKEVVVLSEQFRQLSLDPRHSRYVAQVIGSIFVNDTETPRRADGRTEGESNLIRVSDALTGDQAEAALRMVPDILQFTPPGGQSRSFGLFFIPGDDRIGDVRDNTYIGQDAVNPRDRQGLYALKNIEEVSIVAIPGRTSQDVQQRLITHCESMRYRFAVLDSRERDGMAEVQEHRGLYDSKYAAIYYPWLRIVDPFPENPRIPGQVSIPPSGHIMGIYARSDIERGVHKAPANEVIRVINDLEVKLTKEEQDILNPRNINVLRNFRENNRGLRVWGARTISSDPDWKYVNVRRLFIFVEHSIDRGTQWVVFESNNEPLWERVRRVISAFLTNVWRDGALMGRTKEEAYFVKCDRTTMTQADIDNGRLIVQVGIAPVKPAEFVIFRIGQWVGGSELEEG